MNKADASSTVVENRLESWKEIATHLNRDVRTVQRWAQTRGLPVRRLPGGEMARVYAFSSELDTWWNSRGRETPEGVPTPSPLSSIAVLPFTNLSTDKENEYFSDGLADDIIDALTRLRGLRVIARTSSFAFRGKDADAREIGARLKVATILEGSVRKDGNRVRVSAQLVKAADQSHLWSERYDREMNDIFAIQDEISRAIVGKLSVKLAEARPLVKRPTEKLEAYNLFLQGRHLIHRLTPESLARSKEYLEEALALDPAYALAYVGLAEYYLASGFWGFMIGREAVRGAKTAALQALRLDDTLAEAHAQLGAVKAVGDFDWAGAEKEFQSALELNPTSHIVHFYYGRFCLRPQGRMTEELPHEQRAVELDPLCVRYNSCLGYLYDILGQHDLAMAQHRLAIDLDPGMYMPHFTLAVTHIHRGRLEEAAAEAQIACELSGRISRAVGLLAFTHGLSGRHGEASALLKELTARRRTSYVAPFAMTFACRGVGDMDQMFEWLERGIEERDLMVIFHLKCEPFYTALQGDARYQALLRKMNLKD
jgi:TolB-like protein/Tfp pilus assembly protein PilF